MVLSQLPSYSANYICNVMATPLACRRRRAHKLLAFAFVFACAETINSSRNQQSTSPAVDLLPEKSTATPYGTGYSESN